MQQLGFYDMTGYSDVKPLARQSGYASTMEHIKMWIKLSSVKHISPTNTLRLQTIQFVRGIGTYKCIMYMITVRNTYTNVNLYEHHLVSWNAITQLVWRNHEIRTCLNNNANTVKTVSTDCLRELGNPDRCITGLSQALYRQIQMCH